MEERELALTENEDFKLFKRKLGLKKPTLLPLEVQMQMEREKQQQLEGPSEGLGADIDIGKVYFREANGEEDDNSDNENIEKAMMEIDDMNGLQNALQAVKEPKKPLKVSSKVAPLVAALNEQTAHHTGRVKGGASAEQDQLNR